jgi:transposase
MMLQLEFTAQEQEALDYERFHHPDPAVQRKMEVLSLKSHGLPHEEIARLSGVCENTMRSYFHQYQEGGIERLKEDRRYRHQSELEVHRPTLEAYFREHPPASVGEAGVKIEELTGIRRQPTQVRQFLHRMGMSPRKLAAIPAKADAQVQTDFKKTFWSQN